MHTCFPPCLPLHCDPFGQAAAVEARSAYNGIGVVKLMGREAGFIAAHAALASGDVDLCLIPEVRLTCNHDICSHTLA